MISVEPMSVQTMGAPVDYQQVETPQTQPKESPQEKIPKDLKILNDYFQKIQQSETSGTIFDFVQVYLTFLESKSDTIMSVLQETYPQKQLNTDNLMLCLKSIDPSNWSVIKIFENIIDAGSIIIKKENLTEGENFYITHVMVISGQFSMIYSFTSYLKEIQSSSPKMYDDINSRFIKAFSVYMPAPPVQAKPVSMCSWSNLYSSMKTKKILLVILVVILLYVLYRYFKSSKATKPDFGNSGFRHISANAKPGKLFARMDSE